MVSNTFGEIFRMTTFGESHGAMMGVVVDGCPAGLDIRLEDIHAELALRRPGKNSMVSARQESDKARIVSGVFEGKSTGAPIAILIDNENADSSVYDAIRDVMRPGHANFTYLQKYGVYDYRGGGRASARETVCRVAAGAVANQLLLQQDIQVQARLHSIGGDASENMMQRVEDAKSNGDSIGGVVEFEITNVPVGLGDPVYGKLDAKLASAMMSIPASKGFEIGDGFMASGMRGSELHAEGLLGGISTGMPIVGRVAFKPTPSIMRPQSTVDIAGRAVTLEWPAHAKHDPCVAIRAVPVVVAMCRLVIADALLLHSVSRI